MITNYITYFACANGYQAKIAGMNHWVSEPQELLDRALRLFPHLLFALNPDLPTVEKHKEDRQDFINEHYRQERERLEAND